LTGHPATRVWWADGGLPGHALAPGHRRRHHARATEPQTCHQSRIHDQGYAQNPAGRARRRWLGPMGFLPSESHQQPHAGTATLPLSLATWWRLMSRSKSRDHLVDVICKRLNPSRFARNRSRYGLRAPRPTCGRKKVWFVRTFVYVWARSSGMLGQLSLGLRSSARDLERFRGGGADPEWVLDGFDRRPGMLTCVQSSPRNRHAGEGSRHNSGRRTPVTLGAGAALVPTRRLTSVRGVSLSHKMPTRHRAVGPRTCTHPFVKACWSLAVVPTNKAPGFRCRAAMPSLHAGLKFVAQSSCVLTIPRR